MKVTVCQLDNRSGYIVPMLKKLSTHIQEKHSDFLLLPEMCFSEWLAVDPAPNWERWYQAVTEHEIQISKLAELGAKAVMGTRPIILKNGSFRNEAYIWNPPGSKADCGGLGWIISPEGDILAETDTNSPVATIEVDLEFARSSKNTYPRYVPE
jgi:predicted amidohydrolase